MRLIRILVALAIIVAGADAHRHRGARAAHRAVHGDRHDQRQGLQPEEHQLRGDPARGRGPLAGHRRRGSGKRNIEGKVYLKLPPPFGKIVIGNGSWDGPSSRYANNGVYTYDLPVGARRPEVHGVRPSRRTRRRRVHAAAIDVQLAGSKWKNPAFIASLVLTVLALINVGLVLRVKGRPAMTRGPPDPGLLRRAPARDLHRPRSRLRRRREARQRRAHDPAARACIVVGFGLGIWAPIGRSPHAGARAAAEPAAPTRHVAGVRADRREHGSGAAGASRRGRRDPPKARRRRFDRTPASSWHEPMDFNDSPEEAAWRAECRDVARGERSLRRRPRPPTRARCSSPAAPTTSSAPGAGRR